MQESYAGVGVQPEHTPALARHSMVHSQTQLILNYFLFEYPVNVSNLQERSTSVLTLTSACG